jgi:DNA polymerase III subunit delta
MEPILIVGGPELGRRGEFIRQSLERCAREWGDKPEEHRLYAQDCDVTRLLDLLLNGSLFSAGKFVQYLGADAVKLKADVQALVAYAKNPAERTVLVLVSEGYGVDKAIEDAVPKDAKKIFWELSGAEMERWVRDYFSAQGLGAEPEAIEAVLELVENNTEALKAECSRLALFFPRGARIREEDVERYISHNRSEDAFSLFDRMAQGSFEQALDVLSAILANRDGNGVGLLAGLLWSFRRLSSLHAAMAQGKPYEAAARSLRITSRKLLAQYDAARKRWPPSRCADLVAFGVDTDVQLRALGQAHERVLLELFLYAAMQARELPKLDAAQAVY